MCVELPPAQHQRCTENNVTFCDTRNLVTGVHHTTVTVTAETLASNPSIATYLINICDGEPGQLPVTTVQRFGFALQLYGENAWAERAVGWGNGTVRWVGRNGDGREA